jgi:hypothetical protein
VQPVSRRWRWPAYFLFCFYFFYQLAPENSEQNFVTNLRIHVLQYSVASTFRLRYQELKLKIILFILRKLCKFFFPVNKLKRLISIMLQIQNWMFMKRFHAAFFCLILPKIIRFLSTNSAITHSTVALAVRPEVLFVDNLWGGKSRVFPRRPRSWIISEIFLRTPWNLGLILDFEIYGIPWWRSGVFNNGFSPLP